MQAVAQATVVRRSVIRSPLWHKRLRKRRSLARRRSSGELRDISDDILSADIACLEGHHGSHAPKAAIFEAVRRNLLMTGAKTWPCGRCGWVANHRIKGCTTCCLGKQEAIAAKPGSKKGTWTPVIPTKKTDAAKQVPPPQDSNKQVQWPASTKKATASPTPPAQPSSVQSLQQPNVVPQAAAMDSTASGNGAANSIATESALSAENQAKWDALTQEISWMQGMITGVKTVQGPAAEQRRADLQTQLKNLYAARTELKHAPQRVETLKGVLKRTETQRDAASVKLDAAKVTLVEAQEAVFN